MSSILHPPNVQDTITREWGSETNLRGHWASQLQKKLENFICLYSPLKSADIFFLKNESLGNFIALWTS